MRQTLKKICIALIALSCIGIVVGLFLYRNNAVQAQDKVKNIIAKDTAGTDQQVEIYNLKVFSANHMNAKVAFALQGAYNRAVSDAQAAHNAAEATYQQQLVAYNAAKANQPDVYAAGQAACASHADSIVQARCVQAYVDSHPVAAGVAPTPPPAVVLPTTQNFQYNFASPSWSFDAAGIVITVGIVSLALSLIAYIVVLLWPQPKNEELLHHHISPKQHHPDHL
jgi:hypothetical protein